MKRKPQVFISYCRSDGTRFATKLREKLERQHPEITLWHDVISERGGRDWWVQITEALNQVECMVLVVTPDATKSLTVRKEWRYARQQGVFVYPIQGSTGLEFNALPQWIGNLHIEDLGYDEKRHQFTSTRLWRKFINQLTSPPETARVPFMAADLAENFVERPCEFGKLLELLRDEKREAPVAITAALQGAGGFGKTTLALALCHDERIQEAFDDGILWTTLGENPSDLNSKVVDLIEVLSGERPGFREVDAASARLSELLADRDILMVIDDVWNAVHVRPFLNGGSRCARLITTRNRQTLPANIQPVNVDAMQQSEAIKLLATGMDLGPQHAENLRGLAERLGEWPLLLRLVNAVLRERVKYQKEALNAALDYVQKALIKWGVTAFDVGNAQAREQAVAKTLGVSLDLLSIRERTRFSELAIFREDTDVPLSTVGRLWSVTGGLDDLDSEKLCSRLHGLSLLLSFDLTTRHIRLHDVMRKFLESQVSGVVSIHRKLVDAWDDHRRLPDTYAWRYLPYHLVQAVRIGQLRQLLLDFNWMRAKLEATDIASLLADYDYLGNDVECTKIQGALRLSAHVLARRDGKMQLASQLLGRLLSTGVPAIRAVVSQAAQPKSSAWLRPIKATLISPGGPLRYTLEGHTHEVLAVAISSDSAWGVSASDDRTLKIWDFKNGKLLHSLEGHADSVRTTAITPDGLHAISASFDRTLKVWNIKTGKLVHSLEGHSGFVHAVAIAPDGSYAISASDDDTLCIWDIKSGRLVRSLQGHTDWVRAVAITPDGACAVSASSDATLKIWDLQTAKLPRTLTGHSKAVRAVAITADGTHAVSASDDCTLKIWHLKTGRLVRSLKGHSHPVRAVATAPNGVQVVSASDDHTVKIWSLKTGRLLHSLKGHSNSVRAVAITPDCVRVVSASADHTLKIWDLKTGRLIHTLEGHSNSVLAVAIAPDGAQAISASIDTTLKVWTLRSGKLSHSLEGHSSLVNAVAVSPDCVRVVSASDDHSLNVWGLKTGKLMRSLKRHNNPVRAIAITPDGEQVVSASDDHTLKVWELNTGRFLHSLEGHCGSVWAVAVTPDGARAISASSDTSLKVWNLKSGDVLHSLYGHTDTVRAIAVTPDGLRAVSASTDHSLKIWDLKAGNLLHSLEGHSDWVDAVAVTPDGTQIISASAEYDTTLRVWNLRTGKPLHVLRGHSGAVRAIAVMPDGARIISASGDGTLKIWDLKSAKLLHSLEAHSSSVDAVAITPDGLMAASASEDRTLKIWDLKTCELLDTFSSDGAMTVCAASEGRRIIAGDVLGRIHFLNIEQPSSEVELG